MPNQDRTSTGTSQGNRQPPPVPGEDKSEQDVRDMSSRQSQSQNQPIDEDVEKPDNVEIGDPVPENQRTVRARGETGEDEDLPTNDGNIEGTSGERH